ncbi:MAG TPA: serine hydrolase domain-containing protein [Candidatus Acidoferrales bacterium]|nr:serine hydrolase domain-containing protein [Candidatus Acidoferrales bacterium]
MKTLLPALIFAAAIVISLGASDQAIERLDGSAISGAQISATLSRLMKAADVPGAGLAVFTGGRIAYMKAFGLRNKEKRLSLTVDTVMSAASFSKVAFAYTAMMLVDDGVLDLDKPVQQYLPKPLPEYERYADLAGDNRYTLITARMLLSHTSGFPNWRFLEDDHKLHIHFEPGSRYAYSGEGIDLLQLVVETITKTPLEDLMQARVFKPLGMKRTSMIWQERFENDFANGYDDQGRPLPPQRRDRADAAGSMGTTLSDFSLFLQAVMFDRGLRPKVREQMLSAQIEIHSKHQFPTLSEETTDENKGIRLSYGLGWGLFWTPYGPAFFKEGHDDGWRNYAVCFDQSKTGLLIMTNSGNGEGIYKELLETVLANTFTPIEWEGFTPYNQLPPRHH